MNRAQLEMECLSKKGTTKEFPFGDEVAVFKVVGKMFALIPVDGAVSISLKCDPIRAEMLRQTYPAISGAYHLNKRHWNSIEMDGSVPDDEVVDLIDHSYQLVVKSLTKKQREELNAES